MGSDVQDLVTQPITGAGKGIQGAADRFKGGDYVDPLGTIDSFRGDNEAQPIDYLAAPIASERGDDTLEATRMVGRMLAAAGVAQGLGSMGGAPAGGTTTTGGGEGFTGGLSAGTDAGATMGTGTGASAPSSGLRFAGAEDVLGQAGAASTQPGLNVSPQTMSAFNSGTNLPFAASSGIGGGGEGLAFSGPSSSAAGGSAPAQQPGGLRVGPNAGEQMGIPSTPSTPATSTTPPSTPPRAPTQGSGFVDQLLNQMRNNAVALGLMGASLAAAGRSQPMPSQEQMQGLSDQARTTADQLLQQYRSGTLSAGQAAQLEQLTRQTRNQITQYFASIGQADSTAHMQALAQVDAQALAMKQQMLDGMLQQGLQALGIAQGPLNTIAQYQLGQDQALRQAFGNFATSVGLMAGRTGGTPQPTQQQQPQQPQAQQPQPAASLVPQDAFPQNSFVG